MKICKIDDCVGCGLCQNVCPRNAITMVFNQQGFLQPQVDSEKCIKCFLCRNKCLVNTKKTIKDFKNTNELHFYSAKSPNSNLVRISSSGGVFGEIMNYFLNRHFKNVSIYGAQYTDVFFVKHAKTDNKELVASFHGSKYNQSDTSNTYKNVKKDLNLGKMVVFSGTPCQVFALKRFLGKDYNNLFVVDFLCHGVMSSTVLKDYVKYYVKNDVTTINMRSKEIESSYSSFVVKNNDDILYSENFQDSSFGLGYAFGTGIINRKSCEKCFFRNTNRYSDITLGDFVEGKTKSKIKNQSICVCNTLKGYNLLNEINIELNKLENEDLQFTIERLTDKKYYSYKRKKFFKSYQKNGITDQSISLFKYTKGDKFYSYLKRIGAIFKNGE